MRNKLRSSLRFITEVQFMADTKMSNFLVAPVPEISRIGEIRQDVLGFILNKIHSVMLTVIEVVYSIVVSYGT